MRQGSSHTPFSTWLAVAAHIYTACGVLPAFWAATCVASGHFRGAYLAIFISVLIDATDGTFARWADVKKNAPWIDGRKLDDIVDYLNYTFVPILLLWRGGWLIEPGWAWCFCPLIGSAFGFVHEGAKEEERGFFRGFPSYWNIVTFYIDQLIHPAVGPELTTLLIVGLSVLSVMPVRFVYPNRPPCWTLFFLGGAIVYGGILFVSLLYYPDIPSPLILVSLVYPLLYVITSIYLDWNIPRNE